MNHDDIIRMAREAGLLEMLLSYSDEFGNADVGDYAPELERFAHLVEQHLLQQGYRQCAKGQRTTQCCGLLEEAVAAEREACAELCESRYMGDNNREDMEARRCAAAIRARGQQPYTEDNPSF